MMLLDFHPPAQSDPQVLGNEASSAGGRRPHSLDLFRPGRPTLQALTGKIFRLTGRRLTEMFACGLLAKPVWSIRAG